MFKYDFTEDENDENLRPHESKFSNACCKNGDGAIQVVTLIIVTELCEIVTILVSVQLML